MSLLSSFSPSVMYLVAKMLVCLALAGLAGVLLGWAIGRIGKQKKTSVVEYQWRRTLADTEEEHARVITRFKQSNQSLEDENNNLKTKIAALNAKIDQNIEDVERNKSQQRQLSGQVNLTRTEMDNIKKALEEERAKNHKLQNLTKALKSSSDEKERIAQQLSLQLTDTKNQIQSIQAAENSSEYAALQSEVTELRSADRENADLRKRIAIEAREREDAQAELYTIKQQLENIEREREDYKQWSVRLEQEQAGFDQRVNQAVATAVNKENSKANDLELEVSRLRPMVARMQSQIDQLEDEKRRILSDQQNNRVGDAGAGSTKHIKSLQADLDKLSYERDQLRTRLADQQRQTASLSSQLNSGVNPPEVAGLRKEIAELSAEKGLMSATINELEQKLGL